MGEVRAAILGTGRSYPEGILTNADLERIVETSDEWITSRTGIKERHRAADGEYTSLFAVAAARQAIERTATLNSSFPFILKKCRPSASVSAVGGMRVPPPGE